MARGTPQAYAEVEQWLDRHYARVGPRYVFEAFGLVVVWALVLMLLAIAGLTVHLEGSQGDFAVLLAITEPLALLVTVAGFALWARDSAAGLSWLRGDRSTAAAPAAWSQVASTPVRLTLIVLALAVPAQIGWAFVAAAVMDTGMAGVPPIFLAAVMVCVIAGGGVAVFIGQLAIRPALRDIAPYLPEDFEFVRSRYGLARQLIMRLVVLGLTMTFTGGAVAAITNDPLGRFTLAFTVAPGVLLILGALLFPVAAISLVGPVNELIAATRRVADGDLTAQVQVVTSDELGELSHSFNEMTADLRRMTEDLRESRARIVAASDASRRHVERDLHDGAQQDLVVLNLKLALAEREMATDPQAAAEMLGEARLDLARALQQLRDLAHGIYPAVLENEGLPAALGDAARRSPIPASVECDGAGRYPAELEAAVYFCCLEALQNAGKHAGEGARATLRLAATNGLLSFEVADDGRGFEPAQHSSSAGLQNMADRIGALGGELRIESEPGRGATVTGSVPLR